MGKFTRRSLSRPRPNYSRCQTMKTCFCHGHVAFNSIGVGGSSTLTVDFSLESPPPKNVVVTHSSMKKVKSNLKKKCEETNGNLLFIFPPSMKLELAPTNFCSSQHLPYLKCHCFYILLISSNSVLKRNGSVVGIKIFELVELLNIMVC